MKLDYVAIKNYRSIRQLELHFDPRCRILVGINESGKTNMLNALALLDPAKATTPKDLREPGLHESPITEAHVRFVFNFTEEEISQIEEKVKAKVLSKTYGSAIIKVDGIDYTLHDFCQSRQGLYIANLLTRKKTFAAWVLREPVLHSGWKKIAAACPQDFTVSSNDSARVPLKSFVLIDAPEFLTDVIPDQYLEEATVSDLFTVVMGIVQEQTQKNLLPVLFWDYDEKKLLPPKINLETFCATPTTCLPLQRMFQLYEIADIKKDVEAAKGAGANGLANLLRRVAEKTSEHFHNIWREYDGIKFSLTMDGPDIVASIQDESNHYELSQRSDGFKRFVTFLLMVSAEAESNLLKDTVLLIDEPEIGLHPSGARYLMDELIDISRDNYVVFSTHSIFMIDSKIIKRHLIVQKLNEITQTTEVSESNIQDEEVIFRSLGYSIFSNLKEKNLIFEGWKDKRLFEVALSRVPSEFEEVKELKDSTRVGRCFSHGVKQIRNITPLFEAGDRKCLILSDCDAPAREYQKKYKEAKGFGVWKRYDEVSGSTAITGEDFLKETAFKSVIEDIGGQHRIPVLQVADLNLPDGKIVALRRWLKLNGVESKEADKSIGYAKDRVFDELRPAEIRPEYYEYLKGVLSLLRNL